MICQQIANTDIIASQCTNQLVVVMLKADTMQNNIRKHIVIVARTVLMIISIHDGSIVCVVHDAVCLSRRMEPQFGNIILTLVRCCDALISTRCHNSM